MRSTPPFGSGTRLDAIASTSTGGEVESFHFSFGDYDSYVTADLPANEATAALAHVKVLAKVA